MHADIDGIAEIARSAAAFDWRWTTENAEAFYAAAGWHIDYSSDSYVELRIGAGPTPYAMATYAAGLLSRRDSTTTYLQEVVVVLVEPAKGESLGQLGELTDLLAEIAARLAMDLGRPTNIMPGNFATMRWDLDRLVLRLTCTRKTVSLNIANPSYKGLIDRLEAGIVDAEELQGSHEGVPHSFGPDPWEDYADAVAALLPRMGMGSVLRLRSAENQLIVFTAADRKLTLSIPDYSLAAAGVSTLSEICDPNVWSHIVDSRGSGGWHRSVDWPGHHREYRELADCALAVVRGSDEESVPAATRFEAWAHNDMHTPDTSVLGRSS